MNFRFYFFLILLFLFFSCRKKDNAEPTVTFTSPATGTAFMPGDTIHVTATLSDDIQLKSVTVKLLNAAYIPSDHQESFGLSSAGYSFVFDYILQNYYLTTGDYFLTLTVSDGDHEVNEYRPIVINEIPRTRKDVYVITQPDTTHVFVNTLDAGNQLTFHLSVSGDFTASCINSRYTELDLAGKVDGAFNQIDLTTYSTVFSLPPYNNNLPSFQNISSAHDLAFVSFYDGRIRAFDQTGNARFNSAQPVYYRPGAMYVNDQYVFAAAYYPDADENRLVVINYPSGIARQEFNINLEIVSMFGTDENTVIVFGNSNSDGKIILYYAITNGTNEFHSLSGNKINAALAIDTDHFALATSLGLYSYQLSTNNLVPMDITEPVYSLCYDDVNGILFTSCGKKVKQYSYPSPGVLSMATVQDSILDVRILYNK